MSYLCIRFLKFAGREEKGRLHFTFFYEDAASIGCSVSETYVSLHPLFETRIGSLFWLFPFTFF